MLIPNKEEMNKYQLLMKINDSLYVNNVKRVRVYKSSYLCSSLVCSTTAWNHTYTYYRYRTSLAIWTP